MASRPALLATLAVLLLLALAAAVRAQDKGDVSADADIDRLTDDILAGIATYAKDTNLTAVKLPDVEQRFSTTVLWILSITGSLQLTGGGLTGFDSIRRHESSLLTFIDRERADNPNQLVLRTGIELPKIDATYDFGAHAGVVTQRGKVDVTVSGLKAHTMILLDMGSLKLSMVDLNVADMGKIKVQVKDGVVGWLASAISNLVVSIMKRNLRDAIEQQLPPVINAALDKLDIADMIRPHGL